MKLDRLQPILTRNEALQVSTDRRRPLTAIITAFRSPKSLLRLLRRLRRYEPGLRLLVASDRAELPVPGEADCICLPADVGLSAGRNALLARVQTPYFLLLDDSLQFCRQTKIGRLLSIVSSGDFDLAAGDVLRCQHKFLLPKREPNPQHGTFHIESPHSEGDRLLLQRGGTAAGDGILRCDLTHNFFVARTDRVRAMGGWDPAMVTGDRVEFFYRAWQHGLRIGVCPEVLVRRWDAPPQRSDGDADNRMGLAVAKMGFARMVDFDGELFAANESAPSQAA